MTNKAIRMYMIVHFQGTYNKKHLQKYLKISGRVVNEKNT